MCSKLLLVSRSVYNKARFQSIIPNSLGFYRSFVSGCSECFETTPAHRPPAPPTVNKLISLRCSVAVMHCKAERHLRYCEASGQYRRNSIDSDNLGLRYIRVRLIYVAVVSISCNFVSIQYYSPVKQRSPEKNH